MKALRDLRRFILFKSAEGNQAEIRSYLIDNLDLASLALCAPAESLMQLASDIFEDGALAAALLEMTAKAETVQREGRLALRFFHAQKSAEALGSTVQWRGDAAHLDMISLLASVLTRRQDALVFTSDDFTVTISQAALLDLAKLARVRADLTGFVDAKGLHLRWRSGALNLLSQPAYPRRVVRVVVSLPHRAAAAA